MANNGFNGTTFSFNAGGQTPLVSAQLNESGAAVRVSGSADTRHTYESGLPDEEMTCTIVGIASAGVGDKGTVQIAWFDGTTDSITNCVCIGNNRGGSLDGELTSQLTFKPSTA